MSNLIFNSANLIHIIENEPNIIMEFLIKCDRRKELAWNRIAQAFGFTNGTFG